MVGEGELLAQGSHDDKQREMKELREQKAIVREAALILLTDQLRMSYGHFSGDSELRMAAVAMLDRKIAELG